MTADTTLTALIAADGNNLAVQDWPLDDGVARRGVVVLIHGLGEHAGRYDPLARQLNDWNFSVRGYDQWGHGESGGQRGSLPTEQRLLDDLADVVDNTREHMPAGLPLILLGHSMGGLVAARFVSLRVRPVDGLILSSPALDPGLGILQKALLAVLIRLAPNLRLGNGLRSAYLCHDASIVAAYRADPLVHDRISARLAQFISTAGRLTLSLASAWSVPTLLLYAGDDHLVKAQGSQRFAAAAPATVVKSVRFDNFYHEIFNEPDRVKVFAVLRRWLDSRY
jgi:alpha-beta hydrolase superfamily lysophospholipase